MNPDLSPAAESPTPDTECRPGRWRRFGKGCWRGFRWGTRAGYVAFALAAYLLFHLHQIGLPQFLKRPLLQELSGRGLELDCSRLRLQFGHGLVAESVTLRFRGAPAHQFLYCHQVEVDLDWSSLWRDDRPLIASLGLQEGDAALPLAGAPGEPSALAKFSELSGQLDFEGLEEWRLIGLRARLNNVQFEAMGRITNISHLLTATGRAPPPRDLRAPVLARVILALDQMRFSEPPHVELTFTLDGAALDRSVAQLQFGTAGARGPAGEFDGVRLSANVQPARGGDARLRGVIQLNSAAVRTRWGSFASLRWRAEMLLPPTNQLPSFLEWNLRAESLNSGGVRLEEVRARGVSIATNQPQAQPAATGARSVARNRTPAEPGYSTQLELAAGDITSRWLVATNLTLEAVFWNRTNQWLPLAADWEFRAGQSRTPDFRADALFLRGGALPVAENEQPQLTDFWTNLAPWRLRLEAVTTNFAFRTGPAAETVALEADWVNGRLALTNVLLRVPAGNLSGNGRLEAARRDVFVALEGVSRLGGLEEFLPADFWSQVTRLGVQMDNRMTLHLTARGRLPPWPTANTNRVRDWVGGLAFQGGIGLTNFVLGDVTVDGLDLAFRYAGDRLQVDSLRVAQGGGELTGELEADLAAGDFHGRMRSVLDPLVFRPLITGRELGRQLDFLTFTTPPVLSAEAWGRLPSGADLGLRATVAVTNASYRREPVTELRTALTFTNRELVFTGTEVRQGTNGARVPWMLYDLQSNLLHITNGQASLALDSVARMIGPATARTLAPYHFPRPPEVRLSGAIPVADDAVGDVVFQVRAPELEWWYFRFTNLLATVGWRGNRLSLSNVAAGFYDGLLSAEIGVDLSRNPDTEFNADATFAEVNATSLMADLATATNEIGGVLSGQVIIREGHSRPGLPWAGVGNAQIRDGLLWGLPLFGMLSPVFNTLSPGMGETRFTAGNAFFTFTNNSVDFSRIELLSSAMRIDLNGTVDFDGKLDAVLEARPLRGVPILGAVLDVVLAPFTKLLEYEVRGTLGHPEAELKNMPSFLLAPLQPFKTLKSIFGGSERKEKTAP